MTCGGGWEICLRCMEGFEICYSCSSAFLDDHPSLPFLGLPLQTGGVTVENGVCLMNEGYRASPDWGTLIGCSRDDLRAVNASGIDFTIACARRPTAYALNYARSDRAAE